MKKWHDDAAARAISLSDSSGNATQERAERPASQCDSVWQRAFRSVPMGAVADSSVVQTSGEVSADTNTTVMSPMPSPTILRGGRKTPSKQLPIIEEPAAPSPPNTAAPAESQSAEGSFTEKCRSPRELKSIRDIPVDIGVSPDDLAGAKRLPPECPLGAEPVVPRHWRRTTFAWVAASTWHKPVYFEDEQLERYGHTFGPVTQTALSAVKFFGTVPMLPYYMGVYPPSECIYDLGTYRPGSCAPYYFDPFPLSVRGAINEGLFLGTIPAL